MRKARSHLGIGDAKSDRQLLQLALRPPGVGTDGAGCSEPARQAGQPANVGPYQAVGITTDQIVWYPSVTGAAFYDDNVFARHSNRQGDWAAVVRPEMAWRTNNWANMQLAGSYLVESRSGAFSALALVETSPLLLDVLPVLVPAALRTPRLVDACRRQNCCRRCAHLAR